MLVQDLVDATLEPCKKALADAKLTPHDIHNVVLVGGMTRMPAVQRAVKEFFGKDPHKGVNPDEVVAAGAALQGSRSAPHRMRLLHRSSVDGEVPTLPPMTDSGMRSVDVSVSVEKNAMPAPSRDLRRRCRSPPSTEAARPAA